MTNCSSLKEDPQGIQDDILPLCTAEGSYDQHEQLYVKLFGEIQLFIQTEVDHHPFQRKRKHTIHLTITCPGSTLNCCNSVFPNLMVTYRTE